MSNRQLHIAWERLSDLAGAAQLGNPKAHQVPAIEQSIRRFGFVSPPIRNDDGRLVVGHGRVEALQARQARGEPPPAGVRVDDAGEWLVATVRGVDLTAEDARAYLIADNRATELGGWHSGELAQLLGEIAATDGGLDGVGFSAADLDELLAELGREDHTTQPDPDDVPDDPDDEELYVARGQLWCLGDHRVLCGDATDASDVDRLLAGSRADMAFCDPPYNVHYGHHGGASSGRRRTPLANDHLGPDEWEEFCQAWIAPLLTNVDGALYLFMSSKEWPLLARLLADGGAHWSDSIVWAKNHFTLGRAHYQRRYEPIWYGWPEGAKPFWCGARDEDDVWEIPRPTASPEHATMKPVALVERALRNSSRRGDIVLDLFLGSGTTVLAAERLGRRCFGIDIEPRYVQVTIERWQRFTGRKARLEGDDG